MKTIGLFLLIGINSIINSAITYPQNYIHPVNQADKVVIQRLDGKLTIVEYDGSELEIITNSVHKIPEKAKGLKPIGRDGLSDNTGIGLMATTNGTTISITGVTKQSSDGEYTFKIPKGLSCKIDYTSPFAHDDINIKEFSSELEISTLNSGITMEKVSGPVLLNAINGEITIKFGKVNQDAPISVTAINGEIDVELPSDTPADLNLSTLMGEVYTDFDIAFEKKSGKENGLTYIGGGRDIKGTINGGGVDIMLKTINNNIYLRKR